MFAIRLTASATFLNDTRFSGVAESLQAAAESGRAVGLGARVSPQLAPDPEGEEIRLGGEGSQERGGELSATGVLLMSRSIAWRGSSPSKSTLPVSSVIGISTP